MKTNIYICKKYIHKQLQIHDELPLNYDHNETQFTLENITITVQDVKDDLQILITNKATDDD